MATQSLKDDGDRLTRRRDVERVIKRMTGAFVAAIADLDKRVQALEAPEARAPITAVETDTGEDDGLFL
jgi:hypothetical protein